MKRKSWKTTSAGITSIIGGISGLIYAYKAHNLSQEVITVSCTAILTGIGLMFAKDYDVTHSKNE